MNKLKQNLYTYSKFATFLHSNSACSSVSSCRYQQIKLIHICNRMSSDKSVGKRYVFYGVNATPMFKMEDAVLPELNDGEILVKVRTATICLSDIHTVVGNRIEPTPSVLGHEACVEVVDHKRTNSQLKAGDRITFCIADNCGNCEFCLNGLSQKCVSLFKYGHANMSSGTGYNGCYASHIVIRKGTHVRKLPDQIDDKIASTINCALATMVNCVDSIPDVIKKNGKKALIQGDGMLGLYGCALLREMGFSTVYCSGQRNNRSKYIEKFNAIPLYDDEKIDHEINKLDCVIEVCGSPDVVEDGIKLLKPGGVYIFAGMVHPKTSLKLTGEQIIRKCLTIKGIHNYDDKHLDRAVDFLQETINKYPYKHLISPNLYSLDDLPQAIETAKLKQYPRVCVSP